jgi:hypothetical protein
LALLKVLFNINLLFNLLIGSYEILLPLVLLEGYVRRKREVRRAVAQAVSRWLPTAAARVRAREACGVCGGQSGIGSGFLRVLRFPLPIIPPISPSS